MTLIGGVGSRLSLALGVVVALALGVAYLVVVPPLEQSLTEARVGELERAGRVFAREFPVRALATGDVAAVEAHVANAAVTASARVVVLQPLATAGGRTIVDSHGDARPYRRSAVALRAALAFAAASSIVERDGTAVAEVAYPLAAPFEPTVLLLSAPLDDALATVQVVQRRVLLAGGAALLLALAMGHGAARLFARRLRRLERAADRIARGELDDPVVDRGADEVGELAAAFERMRSRLSQFERARREFIANASHELRTPLFSLGGFLELLADEQLDERTRAEFLGETREQVHRLTKLAADLLDLSRLDAGRLRVELEPTDLAELARELSREFAAVARASEHPLTVAAEPGAAIAIADGERVAQIGRALLENALRHTPPGTPIRVAAAAADGSAELVVEDEGPGVPAEEYERIFERFYRLEGGQASGSGLGLAIARELAERMQGTLAVERRGDRTAFALRLPRATAP